MKRIEGKVLVIESAELRNEVAEWYANFLNQPDVAKEYLVEGNKCLGDLMRQGIENIGVDELIEEASGWAEMVAESEGLIGIVVTSPLRSQQEIVLNIEGDEPIEKS